MGGRYSQILAGERARVGGRFERHRVRTTWFPRGHSVDGAHITEFASQSLAGGMVVTAREDCLEAIDAVRKTFLVVFADIELKHANAPILREGEPEPEIIGAAVDGETV